MNPQPQFLQLGLSLVLGLLVGLQRQRTAPGMPGVRTFPLITVLGTVCGILADTWGGWMVVAGLLGVVAVSLTARFFRSHGNDLDAGTTTDMAAMVMFGVGALLATGSLQVPVAIGGGVAVLLHLKPQMHRFAERLGDTDVKAIMQFVLIALIILPVLPAGRYGPLGVFNPFETWLIVVLIVGMSLAGYLAYRFFGRDAGIVLGGILGGMISSTATTVSYSRQARSDDASERAAAVVIMIASTVALVRVAVAAGIVSLDFLMQLGPPLAIVGLLMLLPSLALWARVRREASPMPVPQNPTQLKSAIVFAILYSVVLLALAAAKHYGQSMGMYVIAGLSGLTDMDAITLSTARMSQVDPQVVADGWRLVMVAALANLFAKTVLAGMLGGVRLLKHLAILFALPLLAGLVLLGIW